MALHELLGDVVQGVAHADEHVAQIGLQGIEGGFVDVQVGQVPFIPPLHRVEQDKGSHERHGDGKYHPGQNAPLVGAVQPGRFQKAVRQGHEIVLHDDQVVGTDAAGKNHGPHRVHQLQILDDEIRGDQSAVEQHGENDQIQNNFSAHQILPGQHISAHHRKEHIQRRANQGDEQRHAQGGEEHGVFKDGLVPGEVKAVGQQI